MAKTKQEGSIEVVAISKGFYDGQRKRIGDVFMVPSDAKGSWFVPTGTVEAAAAEGLQHHQKNALINRPVTLGEIGNTPNKSFNEVMKDQTKAESVKGKSPDQEAKDKAKADKEEAERKAKEQKEADAKRAKENGADLT